MAKKRKPSRNERAITQRLNGTEAVDTALAWIFILAVGLLPLLIRTRVSLFVSPKIEYDILNTQMRAEFFIHYKWTFLLFLSITALALLLVKILAFRFEIRRNYINTPLLILAAMVLVSGVAAEYQGISILGMINRNEGALTILCYLTLVFVAANTGFKKSTGPYITAALGVLVFINTAIILFDFYGKDLYSASEFTRSLINPQGLPQELIPRGRLNSTLGNPNYVSGLASALAAFFLTAALLVENLRKRLLYVILSSLSFTMLLASFSTSGFISLLAAIPVIAILACLKAGSRLHTLAVAGTALLCYLLVFTALNSHNPGVWDQTLGFFGKIDIKKEVEEPNKASGLSPQPDSPANERQHRPDSANEFAIEKQIGTASSGRIYIWGKTVQLIKERPLLGYGPDTLAYYFPQGDPMRTRHLNVTELVDKPHNMYLGVAFGSGVIALGALFILILLHFYNTLRGLLKGKLTGGSIYLQAALFTFWCTFLIQFLFNDSLVTTSPVFWTLFGIGVSLNNGMNMGSLKQAD